MSEPAAQLLAVEWCTAELRLEVDDYSPDLILSCDMAVHELDTHYDAKHDVTWHEGKHDQIE